MSTTVTGNLKTIAATVDCAHCSVYFVLRWTSTPNVFPRVNGTAILVDENVACPIEVGERPSYRLSLNTSTGAITGTVYSTRDAAGTGDGEIDLGGSKTACWYQVAIFKGTELLKSFSVHAKNGVTLDLNSVTPITTSSPVSSPTGDSTYARLDGGNAPFTGQVVAKNGAVGSPGLTFASDLTTGFWRQAAGVIASAIAGTCRHLWNAAGALFGSGGALGWSSNVDPSAAGGDTFIARTAAGTVGIGTTSGAVDGTINATTYKVNGTSPSGSGGLVQATSPTLVTPNIGAATATSVASSAANPAASGLLRGPNNNTLVASRNAANSGDVAAVAVNASNLVALGSGPFLVPAASDTAVGKATTDTLTNKTLTGASSGNSVTLVSFNPPAGALTGNSGDQTFLTITIPANVFASNKGIRLRVYWQHSTGSASVTYKVSFGGTNVFNHASASTSTAYYTLDIFNNGSVSAQAYGSYYTDSNAASFGDSGTTAINTTSSVNVVFTFNVANTDQLTLRLGYAEVIQ